MISVLLIAALALLWWHVCRVSRAVVEVGEEHVRAMRALDDLFESIGEALDEDDETAPEPRWKKRRASSRIRSHLRVVRNEDQGPRVPPRTDHLWVD